MDQKTDAIMYAAQYEYGPKLARVEIVKETDKSYIVGKFDKIMGWAYFGKRTAKKDFAWFDNAADALQWLHGAAQRHIAFLKKSHQDVMERAEAEVAQIESCINELETVKEQSNG